METELRARIFIRPVQRKKAIMYLRYLNTRADEKFIHFFWRGPFCAVEYKHRHD